jgi:hypothetical protein
MACWFWKRCMCILEMFSVFFHFEIGVALHHMNNSKSPSPEDDLCQQEVKNVKVLKNRETMNNRWSENLT